VIPDLGLDGAAGRLSGASGWSVSALSDLVTRRGNIYGTGVITEGVEVGRAEEMVWRGDVVGRRRYLARL
jgi:hypothetical protein